MVASRPSVVIEEVFDAELVFPSFELFMSSMATERPEALPLPLEVRLHMWHLHNLVKVWDARCRWCSP